jgi:NAD-dependent DNA ligase
MDTKKEFLKLKNKVINDEIHRNVRKQSIRNGKEVKANTGSATVTTGIINPIRHRRVVFTGTGPESRFHMIQRANQLGYTVDDKVDRNTTYLVVADTNTNTVKARTARRLGVRIVTYSQFFG